MAKSIKSKVDSTAINKPKSTAKGSTPNKAEKANKTNSAKPTAKDKPMLSKVAEKSTKNTSTAATQPTIKKKKFPASVVFGKPSAKKVEEKPTTNKAKPAIAVKEKPVTTSKSKPAPKVETITAKKQVASKTVVPTKAIVVTRSTTKKNAEAKPASSKIAVAPQPKAKSVKTTQVAKTAPPVPKSKGVTPVPAPKAVATKTKQTTPVKVTAPKTKPATKPVLARYSDEDLAIFRQIIEQQKGEIIEEINSLNERIEAFNNRDFTEESTYSLHMAEQTSDAIEAERARNRISDLTDLVKKLNDAIIRIENKTYGICRICNCLIARERLLVVPVTTLSASYKLHGKCPEDGIDRTEKIK